MSRASPDKTAICQYEKGEALWQQWFASQIEPFLSSECTNPSYPFLRLQYLKAFAANILHNIGILQNTSLPSGLRLPALMNARSHADTLVENLAKDRHKIDEDHGNKALTIISYLYNKYCHKSIDGASLDEEELKRKSDEAIQELSKLSICK